ncbi:hypothetical protein T190115A13A_60201 [Tenacibaculum sp. 190524A02b]|uniref:Uncharacterized protein n=1 Tax=Tenacibaculum vairaonense TaxID=3137860 RepID=A0ABP1FFT0_9FLAO
MILQEEKQHAIEKLTELKNSVPEFTFFGEPRHQAIQAQIRVINEDLDEEDIIDQWGEEITENNQINYITREALEALEYLNKEIELSDLID